MSTRIVIAGMGGVGGYFGGMIAKHYAEAPNVSVYFIARGESLQQIRANGLCVTKDEQSFTTQPTLATDNPEDIGIADFIMICTKSYGLSSIVEQLKPCIGKQTVIIPLLNGADITEQVKSLLPEATVWQGCVYIVSSLNAPGKVETVGNVQSLYFGSDDTNDERLLQFEQLLKEAGIDATYSPHIKRIIWEKFIFISTTATLTCYYNTGFMAIINDEAKRQILLDLIDEAEAIAQALGAGVEKDMKSDILRRLNMLPPESTTSMHRDFQARKTTELSSLTGTIVSLGKAHGISTPQYDRIYSALQERSTDKHTISTVQMRIEIWSDIACPYCYIGKRKFENALAKFPYADEIELVWHSYELNPSLEKGALNKSYAEYLAGIYNSNIEKAKADLEELVGIAKEVGLDYHFDKLIVTNTSDALRLVKLAQKHNLADAAEEILFKAYFTEGKDISDRTTLVRLGTTIGLSENEVNTMLDSDEFKAEIEADIRFSEDELGLEYIPFYLFNGKDVIQGSLAEEEYMEVLNTSYNYWKENGISQSGRGDRRKGRACSPDGTCSL